MFSGNKILVDCTKSRVTVSSRSSSSGDAVMGFRLRVLGGARNEIEPVLPVGDSALKSIRPVFIQLADCWFRSSITLGCASAHKDVHTLKVTRAVVRIAIPKN